MLTRRLFVPAAAAFLFASFALAQDSQSLGDLARETRLHARQADAQAATQTPDAASSNTAPAKPSHVITNEDLPDHSELAVASLSGAHPAPSTTPSNYQASNSSAEQWRSQIQQQKHSIALLQRQIDTMGDQTGPRNCRRGCGQWNARQQERQGQVEGLRAQLQEEQRRLEELQDSARKQGFGSGVYDP